MKTRSEIEEYLKGLGVEIQSRYEWVDTGRDEYGEEAVYTERYMPITGEKVVEYNGGRSIKVINDEAKDALLDLINKSITSGDMETAKTALDVLQSESAFYNDYRSEAIDKSIPADKRKEFKEYCEEHKPQPPKMFDGPLAAFQAAAYEIASNRRTETVNETTSEIKDATIERDNSDREH